MTHEPVVLPLDAPLTEAARLMRDRVIGDVPGTQDDRLCGLLTGRSGHRRRLGPRGHR